jgi:hypothetical protein
MYQIYSYLKLSRSNLAKSCRAISFVNCLRITDVLVTISIPILMGSPETSVIFNQLTLLMLGAWVKYGHEYQGTRTRERLRWQRPAACTKDRPVLSLERAPYKIQDGNCQTVINMWSWSPGGVDKNTYWLTASRKYDFD